MGASTVPHGPLRGSVARTCATGSGVAWALRPPRAAAARSYRSAYPQRTLLPYWALPFLACIGLFLFAERTEPTALRLARGLGWCVLCCTPAILAQDVMLAGGFSSTSFNLAGYLFGLPFQTWVLPGGYIVQQVFESSAKAISGHRQATMMDNVPIYFALTLLWLLPWATVIAARLRRGRLRKDPVVIPVAIVLLANSIAGIAWPWWGT